MVGNTLRKPISVFAAETFIEKWMEYLTIKQASLHIHENIWYRQIWEGAKGTFPSLELFLPPTNTLQLHACMQRSLDKLTEVLHHNPQKYSLRAVTTPIEQSVQY